MGIWPKRWSWALQKSKFEFTGMIEPGHVGEAVLGFKHYKQGTAKTQNYLASESPNLWHVDKVESHSKQEDAPGALARDNRGGG